MVAKHPKVGVKGEGEWREVGGGREGVGLILLQQSRNVGIIYSIMATYTRHLSTSPSSPPPPPPHTHTHRMLRWGRRRCGIPPGC